MNLLLEADPDENIVNEYINKSDMYIGVENEKVVCEIVITEVNQDECELKNIYRNELWNFSRTNSYACACSFNTKI